MTSWEDRRARGHERRAEVPRSAHADWVTAPGRRDAVDVLEEQGASRVAELLPIRYGRMAQSPFAFFRGAAAVMAMDLATTPTTGLRVQACGDAHLSNFGQFATPERNMIFDINDFDETLPGPWEWDVKRLCASIHVVGRQRGFSPDGCDELVMSAARTYREIMTSSSRMRVLELWYDRIHIKQVIDHFPRRYRSLVKKDVKRSFRKTHRRAVAKLTNAVGDDVRFEEDPPLLVHVTNTDVDLDAVMPMVESYRSTLSDERRDLFDRFHVLDIARKVVGVGSVGTRCWVVLLEGPPHPGGDHLVLQVKEAPPSVLERYVGDPPVEHDGRRVVTGQRLTQAASDLFLGWTETPDRRHDYYVRQLWDFKGQGDPMIMAFDNLNHYGALCGWALARAHARTGDPAELAGYLGTSTSFDRAMAAFSAAYARTNEQDHALLLDAIASGRLPAA